MARPAAEAKRLLLPRLILQVADNLPKEARNLGAEVR